jgi:predicted DNA-binding WGR domain protein
LRPGPKYSAEVEALINTINAGNYGRAAKMIEDLLQKDLTRHYRQRVQAQGIAVAFRTDNKELMEISTSDVSEPITSEVLAVNLAWAAAIADDKPNLLKYIRWALRTGKGPERFLDDAGFARYKSDPDFMAVLDGTALPEPITSEFYIVKAGKEDPCAYSETGIHEVDCGVPCTAEIELPKQFNIKNYGADRELPHLWHMEGWYIFSLQFLEALKKIGIDRFQTFPAVITDRPSGRAWNDYVAVNVLGRDNVLDDEETDNTDEHDVWMVLDDRKLNNCDKFLAVSDPSSDFFGNSGKLRLIFSDNALLELKQYAPAGGKWGFRHNEIPVSDHSALPDAQELTVEEWCAKSERFLEKTLWTHAAECAQKAIDRDDGNYLGWYCLARATTNDPRLCRDDCEHKKEKEARKAYIEKSIGLYEKSLELNPNNAQAWLSLSVLCDGDKKRSAECLYKALEADNECEEAYIKLVEHRDDLPWEERCETVRKWTENMPENLRAWYSYSKYLGDGENRDLRIAAYEKMLSIQRIPLALYHLGNEYRRTDPKKALSYLLQITKQDKKDFSRGWWMLFDYMWDSIRESIADLKQELSPIAKVELADAFSSEKVFWTLETKGSSLTVTTGKMGSEGASETVEFDSEEECQNAAHDLYDENIKKYYPADYFHFRPDLQYEQSPQAKALEAKFKGMLEKIESLPKEDLAKLPEGISDPRAVLDALDDEDIIDAFTADILSSMLAFKGLRREAQGAAYEWYYDGDNNGEEAYGYFYEKCEIKDGDPKFGGKRDDEVGGISVYLVMEALYDALNDLYGGGFSEPSLIGELFETKVFLLAERAYREAEKTMDLPLFFMNQHDDNPTFIAAPRRDSGSTTGSGKKTEPTAVKDSGAADAKRTFVFTDGKSDKFWSIETKGASFTVVFGRTGASGQTSEKAFASEDECRKAAAKLISEKTKKGYREEADKPIAKG